MRKQFSTIRFTSLSTQKIGEPPHVSDKNLESKIRIGYKGDGDVRPIGHAKRKRWTERGQERDETIPRSRVCLRRLLVAAERFTFDISTEPSGFWEQDNEILHMGRPIRLVSVGRIA